MTKSKSTKFLKYGLISAFSLIGIFAITLIVHIAIMVGNKSSSSFHQLARVDFSQDISDNEVQQIEESLKSEKGFVSTYFNDVDKILVYKFDKRYNNSSQIYANTIQPKAPNSTRFIVTEAMQAKGCPVISDDSFYGKLTATVTQIMY
ncbi:MAG TPA: hypothetical protein VLZ75_06845 [Chitinophagales bacterium]|nr:hypothetical protein [Chitinophagales bacterium]